MTSVEWNIVEPIKGMYGPSGLNSEEEIELAYWLGQQTEPVHIVRPDGTESLVEDGALEALMAVGDGAKLALGEPVVYVEANHLFVLGDSRPQYAGDISSLDAEAIEFMFRVATATAYAVEPDYPDFRFLIAAERDAAPHKLYEIVEGSVVTRGGKKYVTTNPK